MKASTHPLFIAAGSKHYPQWIHVLATKNIYETSRHDDSEKLAHLEQEIAHLRADLAKIAAH